MIVPTRDDQNFHRRLGKHSFSQQQQGNETNHRTSMS
jgi:hypothetical protein